MNLDRRRFAKAFSGAVGSLIAGRNVVTASAQGTPTSLARAQARLPPAKITRIRVYYPPNYDRNGPQAFPQSNLVVLVDTDVGITGIGQGGSPDTVRNVARSVVGKNPFDTEMIWQAAFMDGFYTRQGTTARTRRHRPGAVGYQGQSPERAALSAVRGQSARASKVEPDQADQGKTIIRVRP
jgi:hypothetical protein